MSLPPWITVAIAATLPLLAAAQERNVPPSPDDPNLKVPLPVYQSALRDYRPAAADEEKTPDKVWRNVNEDMLQLGGHAAPVKEAAGMPEDIAPASTKEH